jgi:hypothetical protein
LETSGRLGDHLRRRLHVPQPGSLIVTRRQAAVIVLLPAVLLACGNDDENTTGGTLRNAAEIDADTNAADARRATLGDTFEVDGVSTTIDSITVVEEPDSEDRPFFVIHVRAENPSDKDRVTPDVGIVCAQSDEPGDALAYSTYLANDALPPKSFRDGFAWRTGPGDPRTGEPPTDCLTPAYLHLESSTDAAVRIDLTDDMVAAINAEGCSAQGGPNLAESTISSNPVVCATFGTGPTPATS